MNKQKKIIKNKKGQAWSIDIMISILIFFAGVSILFFYSINYNDQANSSLADLFNQGNTASNLLLSNEELGLLSNSIINQTLLNNFYNSNYSNRKTGLGIRDNFYFTLDNLEVDNISVDYVGNINTTIARNLIKIERIVTYKNKPSKFDLYIWK